jgi:hypothetical protein
MNEYIRPNSAYWWLTGKIIVICLDMLSSKLYRRDSTISFPGHPKTSKNFYALSADKSGYNKLISHASSFSCRYDVTRIIIRFLLFFVLSSQYLLPRCWLHPLISNLQRTKGRPCALNLMADCTQYKYSNSCEKMSSVDVVEGEYRYGSTTRGVVRPKTRGDGWWILVVRQLWQSCGDDWAGHVARIQNVSEYIHILVWKSETWSHQLWCLGVEGWTILPMKLIFKFVMLLQALNHRFI